MVLFITLIRQNSERNPPTAHVVRNVYDQNKTRRTL